MDEQISLTMTARQAMKRAIAEALKGAPFVAPNPLVGCVILDSKNRFLSCGFHQIYAGAHAEVNALAGLTNEQLKDAHVIVTLEPCAHQGKTPSCAKALAALPIKKVTYGLMDPNPLVAGQGAEILKAAGKEVELFNDLTTDLEELCEIFLMNQRHKKIFVALKVATSLDGQMALKTGESQWITGEQARENSHYLRACYDAVMVGAGTLKHDNPSLNVRHPLLKKENKVVILDFDGQQLKNFSNLRLSKAHAKENIFWCVSDQIKIEAHDAGPKILKIKTAGGGFQLNHLMSELWNLGLRSLYVEGGAHTFASLIRDGFVHRLYIYQAPYIIGAGGGLSWTKALSISRMDQRYSLQNLRTSRWGDDWLLTARFLD